MFGALMQWMKAKKILPRISDTERAALEAGTVWIDGDFFRGTPDFDKILAHPYSELPPEERAFLDGPVEELCRMSDRYEIGRTKKVPDHVLAFIKSSGMMGLRIPKKFGGKGFSTLGISTIMAKINPHSTTVGTFVVIPNSLGAGELIEHYGTQAQKDHYLPRLARGEYVPCFGLTEPTAGSDAASIKSEGVVFRAADGVVSVRMNFRKRYITLAPIANLVTLACQLHDPENLLGKGEHPGITCILIHEGTPGFKHGDHHDPIGDPFYNGPLEGKDVVVPAENIIGGAGGAGMGWGMLMQQLAGGRAVSLPAGAIGGIKAVTAVAGAYSTVRQQFGIPIGLMEGVEEKIGKIAAMSYLFDAARVFACSAIDAGAQPPVVSAILKAYATEGARHVSADAMDILAGSGVMKGPNNIIANGYASIPVGVTVEGANILTRTLMIFGQGATRCHPYALKVVHAVESDDVAAFRSGLLGWIGHFIANIFRAGFRYWTRGAFAGGPAGPTAVYYHRLGWAATRFAVMSDLAMFTIGGKLKIHGKLTGRYSDALAWMVLGTSALRRWEAEGRRAEDLPLVHYALQHSLANVQLAFEEIYANFPAPVLGGLLRSMGLFMLRANPVGRQPLDALSAAAARTIQSPTRYFEHLMRDIYAAAEDQPGAGRLFKAFRRVSATQPIIEKITAAQRARKLPRGAAEDQLTPAVAAGIITATEAARVSEALAARLAAIEVDQFAPKDYFVGVEVAPAARAVAAAPSEQVPERRVA